MQPCHTHTSATSNTGGTTTGAAMATLLGLLANLPAAARRPPQGSATRSKFQSLSAVSNKLISDTCNSYDHPPVVLVNRAQWALTCVPSSKPCPTEKNFRAREQSIQILWLQVLRSSACGAHSSVVTSCLGRCSVKMMAVTSFAHRYFVPVFEYLRTLYFTKK